MFTGPPPGEPTPDEQSTRFLIDEHDDDDEEEEENKEEPDAVVEITTKVIQRATAKTHMTFDGSFTTVCLSKM